MRIVHLVPGSGGTFYCGNCMRDTVYINALRKLGHEIIMVPLYLPLNVNDFGNFGDTPVFFGAVSLYLKQQFAIFRNMPEWLEHWLDSPFILKMAAKKAGSTRATGLEEMTISMLEGDSGNQRKELDMLIAWLKEDAQKPDIVHFSNALLLGLAPRIKRELGVKVVCSLQDEDVWLDVMKEPYRSQCWSLVKEQSQFVDRFISASRYFATFMEKKIGLDANHISVIRPGIDVSQYKLQTEKPKSFTIGYLSRLCEGNGLGILIDAFIELKANGENSNVKLRLTGGYTSDNFDYIRLQKNKLRNANLQKDVEFVEDFYGNARNEFLNSLTLLTVPVIGGEALGVYLFEAMACGIPIIQPNEGAFPEIIENTKGGLLFSPNTSSALCQKLRELIQSPEQLEVLGQNGYKNLKSIYSSELMAKDILAIYSAL